MTFFLAPALVKLRDQVNNRFPNRDKASDGWIGDPAHQARVSSHNPDWEAPPPSEGIVRGLDIDISPDGNPDKDLRAQLLRNVIGDHRVWYVISNGKIYSRTFNWEPREYTGSNPHFEHVHISLIGDGGEHIESNFDTSSWFPPPRVRDDAPRIVNFRDTAPEWDVKILDRAIKHGRKDLIPKVEAIEAAVKALPDDDKNTRVQRFIREFKNDRILDMRLLNEAIAEGRTGAVLTQRDALRVVIKSILRH